MCGRAEAELVEQRLFQLPLSDCLERRERDRLSSAEFVTGTAHVGREKRKLLWFEYTLMPKHSAIEM